MEYYMGLDMGTSSVGWAVTDEKYNLIKKHGKDMWGIREFEEADTAEARRTFRVARRRRQREVVRIGLLKEYFHDEVIKVDPNFFQRLENSKYFQEDKDEEVNEKYGILRIRITRIKIILKVSNNLPSSQGVITFSGTS